MTLPLIGESLDPKSTLEAQARKTKLEVVMCWGCHASPYPRGYDPESRLCWYCSFPRKL